MTITFNNQPLTFEDEFLPRDGWDEYDPHCVVCGRHTDHVGEHDTLVGLGFARYTRDGWVMWTDAGHRFLRTWGPYGHRVLARAEWGIYQAEWARRG